MKDNEKNIKSENRKNEESMSYFKDIVPLSTVHWPHWMMIWNHRFNRAEKLIKRKLR